MHWFISKGYISYYSLAFCGYQLSLTQWKLQLIYKHYLFCVSMCIAISIYVCGNTTKRNYDHHKCYGFLKIMIWFHFWEAVICSHGSVICSSDTLYSAVNICIHASYLNLCEEKWKTIQDSGVFQLFSECYFG